MIRRDDSQTPTFKNLVQRDIILPRRMAVADARGRSDPGLTDLELVLPCGGSGEQPCIPPNDKIVATLDAGTIIHIESAWYTFYRSPDSISETYGIAEIPLLTEKRRAQFSWRMLENPPRAPWE